MPPITQAETLMDRLARILLWGLLGVVLIGVGGLGIRSLVRHAPLRSMVPWMSSPRPPIYGSLPDFALTDQRGRPIRRADLQRRVWVASFIFTTCPDECPLMTAAMARLQSELVGVADVRLVSISVDPEHDTPAILSQYAARFDADSERWFFLTGDKRAIFRLASEGFRLGIVDPTERSDSLPVKEDTLSGFRGSVDRPPASFVGPTSDGTQHLQDWSRYVETAVAFADHAPAKDTLHSARFVLVDRRARIRGYYDSGAEAALQRLRQHLQMLLRED